MPKPWPLAIDSTSPPFDRYQGLRWLGEKRSGHKASDDRRHQLYTGREKQNPVNVLIKVTSKPGLVYEQDINNEWISLSAINSELPDSRYFPFVHDRGRLPDGRIFLITSLFDEFPLATTVSTEWSAGKLVTQVRIAIEMTRALVELHHLGIFHVDLNPMNVLYRMGTDRPVIRIVDFESSYERRRHSAGTFYNPPTTPGYSAPEVGRQTPDARADVFSVGAVLYTLLAGYRWSAGVDLVTRVASDEDVDAELRDVLLRAVDPLPDRRYASMESLQVALGSYLETIWPGRSW